MEISGRWGSVLYPRHVGWYAVVLRQQKNTASRPGSLHWDGDGWRYSGALSIIAWAGPFIGSAEAMQWAIGHCPIDSGRKGPMVLGES